MKLSELKELLEHIRDRRDLRVTIPIRLNRTTVGGQPSTNVVAVTAGIDWDNGKLFIVPETTLMQVDDCEGAPETIKKQYDKIGWLEYENRNLKADVTRLRKKVKELEDANENKSGTG